ncbi:MAG: amidohydrolase family protein [Chloroflexi bacterium]|nr:amidohydrolase family protein [Chloroflexota bacterium]
MTQQQADAGPAHVCTDIHAHIAPLAFLQEVKRSASSFGIEVEETPNGHAITFPGLPTLRPAGGGLCETEDRARWMDSNGIGRQILAVWLDIQGYTLPKDTEATWVRLLNEHISQISNDSGGRYGGLAAVPLRDGDLAAKELEYAVTTLGMSGTMLPSDPVDIDISDSNLEPLWAAAESLNVPVLLHGASHSKWANVGPPYLAFSLGRTLDTTILAAKLILGGLLDRYPKLKLMLCHGGGFLPYQIGRIHQAYLRGMEKLVDLKLEGPESYLPMMYYDTVTLNPRSLHLLLDLAGSEHVMLGSDYVWEPMGGGIKDAVEAAGLTPQQVDDIYSNSASKLFQR